MADFKAIDIKTYTYELTDDRIAKKPVEPRDSSKLLVYQNGEVKHQQFTDLSDFLPSNSTLVFNDTKVIPARLHFSRSTGALIEVFLLNPMLPSSVMAVAMEAKNTAVWKCVVGNKKKWKTDEVLTISHQISDQEITLSVSWENQDENRVRFRWNSNLQFSEIIEEFGKIPLPPYLNRAAENSDIEDYQTVYSKIEGAVAAPTAGLHFTDSVLNKIAAKGIKNVYITLHVGAGTFMPVKHENALEHPMHNEQLVFTKEAIQGLIENIDSLIPVGTTSMRSLESLYWYGVKLIQNPGSEFFIEKLFPYEDQILPTSKEALEAVLAKFDGQNTLVGQTEILIFPGYEFKLCKGLVTNFHQPQSTLLLLVAALVGEPKWKEIYQEALQNDYRFLSFGDSSLLIPG
ncbi:S-adenosylmethionine:tRNA ribosyltransferase-isomerase [Lacihabitans lacunae]|uniref:S-adenosylmethionine:tRNA ribosyltransferase-isomerase n=1 Tax=Lacihabitans lacunae TaxID=1028214 RepID=A0ABV7YYE9_9BACT